MAQDLGVQLKSPEMQMLSRNKISYYNYRKRREDDWNENYLLYRDKVKINRLTQRQSVHIPLMKMTIKTILKDVDDMPLIYFENRDNDKEKEIFLNAYWEHTISPECNNMEIQDIIDKKQEMLTGRTYDQMQIIDGVVRISIVMTEDILVDRYVKPWDLDTTRGLIHLHIFEPLASLSENEDYDQKAVEQLKKFYSTQEGLIKSKANIQSLEKKNQKMSDMGLDDANDPILGETYVELSMHFLFRESDTWVNEKGEKETVENQYMMYVEADDQVILMKKPLEKVLDPNGNCKDHYWANHLNYNSWASDVEATDWYSDGVADVVRPHNKIVDVFWSQKAENRVLRSYGMHYFDASLEGFQPPNIEPEPWAWFQVPVPSGKNIDDVFKKVDIPDISDAMEDIKFVIGMNDRASGATPTQQGVPSERQITLGEVKLALTEAQEQNRGMSKFYTVAWKKRAEKFLKLVEASPDKIDAVKLYKKGRNTDNVFAREIAPEDWQTQSGYGVKIWSKEDKTTQDVQQLQKLTMVRSMMPGNSKLDEIIERKALNFANLTPDEVGEVMRQQNEMRQAMLMNPMAGAVPGQVPQRQMPGQPVTPPMPAPGM